MLRCYTVFIFATLGVLIGYNLAKSKLTRENRTTGIVAATVGNYFYYYRILFSKICLKPMKDVRTHKRNTMVIRFMDLL